MSTAATEDLVLTYHETGIVAVLVLVSFLILLNVADHLIDKIL